NVAARQRGRGRDPTGGGRPGPAARRGSEGRRAPRRARGGQGAVQAVLHLDPRRAAPRAVPRARCAGGGGDGGAGEVRTGPAGPAPRRTRRAGSAGVTLELRIVLLSRATSGT